MENKHLENLINALEKNAKIANSDFSIREKQMEFSKSHWKAFGETGIHGAFLPAQSGGKNLNYAEYAQALNRLGYYSEDNGLNFSIMAHALACLWPLHLHATSDEIKKLIPEFANGKLILSNAITEEHGGSDVYTMKTTAKKTEKGYLIHGAKSFCSNIPGATHIFVYAETSPGKGFFGGISAFLVPVNTNGIKPGANFNKMGLRTCASSTVEFNQVEVPAWCLIGKEGSGAAIFQESMVFEKVYMASAHTGTLQRWLEQMEKFSRTRLSGGQPLVKNQSIAHTLADVKIQLEASKALLKQAVELLEKGNLSQKITYAAIVKHFVSNNMVNISQKYLNLFGGEGFKVEAGIEVQVRDFMASTIYSGTSEIQKNIISSSLNN